MEASELYRQGKLEEYRTLRAEVLGLVARQGQQQVVGWGATIALLSASWVSGQPALALLSVLFVAVAWREHLRLSTALRRLGEYIAVAVEPHVPGLEWESRILEFHKKHVSVRSLHARVLEGVMSVYGILTVIALVVSTVQLVSHWPADTQKQVLGALLWCVCILSAIAITRKAASLPLRRGKYAEEFTPEPGKKIKDNPGKSAELGVLPGSDAG